MTSTREADRHHLFGKTNQSGWPSGDSRLSLSPCTSFNEDMEALAKHLPLCCLCQLHQHLPHGLLYLGWVSCIMHAYDGWDEMCKLTSGLASCTLCNAVEYSLHMVRLAFSTCSFDLSDTMKTEGYAIHDAGE
jgi:hypothetical protein